MQTGRSMIEWASKPTSEVVDALKDEWTSFTDQFEDTSATQNEVLGNIEPLIATLISRTVALSENTKEVYNS